MSELVSIIIPVYNSGEFLMETLTSVYAQTYKNIEVIIVDNGSDDPKTLEVLAKVHDKEKTTVYTIREKGVSNARNVGVEKASGTFILPLDADDLIQPTYIAKCVKALGKDTSINVVSTGVELFGKKTGILPLPAFSYPLLLARNLMVVSCMFKKTDFIAAGGYDPDFIHGFEDWEFWIRFLNENSNVHHISEPLFRYRIRKNSRNHSLTEAHLTEARKMVWQKHSNAYAKFFVDPKETFEYQLLLQSAELRIGSLLMRPFRRFRLMQKG